MTPINETLASRLSAILCADWGKEPVKRAVYVADVAARVVRRLPGKAWSLAGLFTEAQRWKSTGSVLVTVDAPVGVPESFLAASSRVLPGPPAVTFLDLLANTESMPRFFDASTAPGDWRLERPFFAVPAGIGGLNLYVDAAASHNVTLKRRIDIQTAANSVFIKSGIPGSVGSAACALWRELVPLLRKDRSFAIWPFDGDLHTLLRTPSVVVGEIYPRAAYATALLPMPPSARPRLGLAKTKRGDRREAIAALREADWIHSLGMTLENLAEAEANEDDFDACLTAAALARCVLEGTPVAQAHTSATHAEGGMLGLGSINLQLRERKFEDRSAHEQRPPARPSRSAVPMTPPTEKSSLARVMSTYVCPIPGCDKVYQRTRGGWDAHIGSLRTHPNWHPELANPEDRKMMYRIDFPEFFG